MYKYRWWLAFLWVTILSTLGGVFFLLPQLNSYHELIALHQQKKLLSTDIQEVHDPPGNPKSEMKSISTVELLQLAQTHSLLVQINKVAGKENEVKIIVEGKFSQLSDFLVVLLQKFPGLVITNFSFLTTATSDIKLTMTLGSWEKGKTIKLPNKFHDAFCHAPFQFHGNNKTDNIPLNLMRMVGYIQQGTHHQSLIKMPNNTTLTIKVGQTLGKERGEVVRLLPEKTFIQLPNKKIVTLRMQTSH